MKKNILISIPQKIFWKYILPGAFIAGIIGIISGILIVDHLLMPKVVGVNRDVVEVPDVKGMEYEKAREKFYKAGLLTEIRSKEYDNQVPDLCVISQFPENGEKVKKGRKVALIISKGKEIAVIPDVRNLSERQARIELKKNGFTLGNIKKIFSEERAVDMVIDAFPASGTTTSRELEVDLYVSKGPKPTHTEMPNLAGESIGSAKKLIEDSGLVLGKIEYKNNPALLPGTIISQSIAPGAKVPLDSKVNLVVSVIR
ncbi:MAG TPA: PASTA domain-containing protein [Chitinispirillaceae bacterium]|nr:PASTA domain-containing protein [Chitinispirillaceae bacterium]